jgi:hypothetical protein
MSNNTTITTPPLTKDLHLRLDQKLDQQLQEIAALNLVKKSAFARIILLKHIHEYIPNRGFI